MSGDGNVATQGGNTDDMVYKVAVELTKTKPLKINELYNACVSKLGLTPSQVNSAIFNLLKKKLIVEGTKLTYEDIMKNPLRVKIHEYIKRNPGSRVRDIRRAMNIDNAESKWHLGMLEKFGYFRKKAFGKYVAYYTADFTQDYDELLCMLHQDTAYRVFYDIFSNANASIPEVAHRLSLHPSTVKYHVDKLLEKQLMTATQDPSTNQTRFTVNAEMWGYITQIAPGFLG